MEYYSLAYSSGDDILKYILAGHSIFTIRNSQTMNRFTYKVTLSENKECYFVQLLVGEDNRNGYQYIGWIQPDVQIFAWTRSSSLPSDHIAVLAISAVIRRAKSNTIPPNLEFFHSGKCLRCGRLLTVPESIQLGFGSECITKL